MKKKVISMVLLMTVLFMVALPMSAFAAPGAEVKCTDAFGAAADSTLADTIKSVIKIIGGVGGLLFTLAVMVIAVMIMIGSISAQKRSTYWIALLCCFCGAFVFFGGYKFADAIAKLAQSGSGC